MLRSIKVALAAGIIAAAVAPSVGAHYQAAACNGVVTTYGEGAATIYTDDRGDGDPVPVSIPGVEEYWVYIETNGHPGLQAGGSHAALGPTGDDIGFRDSCTAQTHGVGNGRDSILF